MPKYNLSTKLYSKARYQMWITIINRTTTFVDCLYGSNFIHPFYEYCRVRVIVSDESDLEYFTYKADGVNCDMGFIKSLAAKTQPTYTRRRKFKEVS